MACALTEICNLVKPVVFGFSLKTISASTIKDLKQIIDKMIEKPSKKDSGNPVP